MKLPKSLVLTMILGLLAALAGCSSGGSSGGGPPPVLPDTTPPTVLLSVPAQGATGVPLGTTISVTFDEALDPLTIDGTSFLVANGGPVAGAVVYDDVTFTATFTPGAPLTDATVYTVTLTAAITDTSGNALVPVTITFTSEDFTPPVVVARTPAPASLEVPATTLVTVEFDEPMDGASVEAAGVFTLVAGGPVAGLVEYFPAIRTAVFTPSAPLVAATTYTATMTTGAQDTSGNALVADVTWTFTVDATAPTVVSTVPAGGTVDVALFPTILATFDEAIDPATLTATSFTLSQLAGPGVTALTIGYDPATFTASFVPDAPLLPLTAYRAMLSATITDVAGNPLAGSFMWDFVTGQTGDVTPPTVGFTSPFDGEFDVSLATHQRIEFSEPMNRVMTEAAISIFPAVPMLFFWGPLDDEVTIVFDTTAPPGIEWDDLLAEDTTYTVTIATTATDVAGNGLLAPVSIGWTTWADLTAPQVSSFVPDLGTTLALPLPQIQILFDEAMFHGYADIEIYSMNDTRNPYIDNFVLTPDQGMELEWSAPNRLDVVFNTPLLPDTEYGLWISAVDASFNPYDEWVEYTFVTAGSRVGAPVLASSSPGNGAMDVPIESALFLSFSRPMAADLLNHVSVVGLPNSAIELERTVDPPGVIVTPKASWPPLAPVTVMVAGSATDASGNALGAPASVAFTTGPATPSAWGLDPDYCTLKDGAQGLELLWFYHVFRFEDAAGNRVILDQQIPAHSISIVEQGTGLPMKGYQVDAYEAQFEIWTDFGTMQFEPNTTYELTFGSTFVDATGLPITPTTLTFTTMDVNGRPSIVWLAETEDVMTTPFGTTVEFEMWLYEPDGNAMTLQATDQVDPFFAPVFTEIDPGTFTYLTPGLAEPGITTTQVVHPLEFEVSDGTAFPGHTFTVRQDIFPYDPTLLPGILSPIGGVSVPGGVPTYSLGVPAATRDVSQALLLAVYDDFDDVVLFTVLPPTATSFAHPVNDPLPSGSYTIQVGALHFGPGLLRGIPNGLGVWETGSVFDFFVP